MQQANVPYDFNEHKHRYAIWTVARAQRAFATNEIIAGAVEQTRLRWFAENVKVYTAPEFDAFHREVCNSLIAHFPAKKCSYGRAAKMVAIYLKTSVVLPQQAKSALCEIIHPPIDRILLQQIADKTKLKLLKQVNWTSLNHDEYWQIISDLQDEFGYCNWRIEQLWASDSSA